MNGASNNTARYRPRTQVSNRPVVPEPAIPTRATRPVGPAKPVVRRPYSPHRVTGTMTPKEAYLHAYGSDPEMRRIGERNYALAQERRREWGRYALATNPARGWTETDAKLLRNGFLQITDPAALKESANTLRGNWYYGRNFNRPIATVLTDEPLSRSIGTYTTASWRRSKFWQPRDKNLMQPDKSYALKEDPNLSVAYQRGSNRDNPTIRPEGSFSAYSATVTHNNPVQTAINTFGYNYGTRDLQQRLLQYILNHEYSHAAAPMATKAGGVLYGPFNKQYIQQQIKRLGRNHPSMSVDMGDPRRQLYFNDVSEFVGATHYLKALYARQTGRARPVSLPNVFKGLAARNALKGKPGSYTVNAKALFPQDPQVATWASGVNGVVQLYNKVYNDYASGRLSPEQYKATMRRLNELYLMSNNQRKRTGYPASYTGSNVNFTA